ncbi:MAG: Gfo/Idh/MocA family oxidoreductase [Clostridia bacterium]|nr:Gfo/Idh/MocA family oxidoreductase [Clostridia bacterium]
MFRIGIIGTENSHATDLARRLNLSEDYPDCRVTLVWGHYPDENRRIARDFNCSVAQNIDEMVENTDAVLVTARDGKFHAEFARPFIEAGKPAFIDKPFTVDVCEASELILLAKEKGVPLCGGSTLKYADAVEELKAYFAAAPENVLGGSVFAPVVMDSEYSGFFFYSPHLAEMTLEIFGYAPKAVTAVRNPSGVFATIDYGSFCVANHFGSGAPDYCASVYSKSGSVVKAVDLSMIGAKNCEAFVNMLRTGRMPRTYEELLAPVKYLNAVKKAYETGTRVGF